jgi:hypothetical protein
MVDEQNCSGPLGLIREHNLPGDEGVGFVVLFAKDLERLSYVGAICPRNFVTYLVIDVGITSLRNTGTKSPKSGFASRR